MSTSKLFEYTKDFGVSRPIFKLELDRDGSSVGIDRDSPLEKFTPKHIEGDALYEVVADNYREIFSMKDGVYSVDRWEIANNSMRHIRNCILSFIEKNLEMRNPSQSKLYRWAYRQMPTGDDFNEVVLMLYKYMRSFCDSDMKANNIEYAKNTLALLEAIMERYNE